jgi:hypothetical protein
MLRACLDSLARQRVDLDLIVSIVVVDNEEHPAACARVGGQVGTLAAQHGPTPPKNVFMRNCREREISQITARES